MNVFFKWFMPCIIASTWMFVLAGLGHMYILHSLYAQYLPDNPPAFNYSLIYLGFLLIGIILSLIFSKLANKTLANGIILGSLLGILWITPHQLMEVDLYGYDFKLILIDGLWHIFEQGSAGAIIAILHAKSHKLLERIKGGISS